VVEQAMGEHLDGTPLDNPNKGKNPVVGLFETDQYQTLRSHLNMV
jgi:hypothetical protein